MPSALGTKVKDLRRKKGLTLEQLAQLTDSSKSYMWELENKDVARPSAEKLGKIAEQLDTTVEFLLDGGEQVSEEDAADAHFYRQYRKLDSDAKERIRRVLKALE